MLSPGVPIIMPLIGTGGLEPSLTQANMDFLMPDSHTSQPFIQPPYIRPTCIPIISIQLRYQLAQDPDSFSDYIKEYLKIYDIDRSTGLPNYLAARIPLKHKLNMSVWRRYMRIYHYPQVQQLRDFLEFGFPIDYMGSNRPVIPCEGNHLALLAQSGEHLLQS